ncbi:hypothetical protein FOCC_FOCC014228 [Frankliniella occidentalis]|nr:hypothetical protein FOCC_FOCC014228 [Frankliniella occidentalis]
MQRRSAQSRSVQCSADQRRTAQISAVQICADQCCVDQCRSVLCRSVQISAVQIGADQCSADQCSADQCSSVQRRLVQVVVALVVPNLRPVLALVGAVGFSTLGLLFPALVDLVVHWRSASALRVTKDVLIMLFWLVALLAGTYSALLEIMDTYFTEPQAA